jgi:hypothetical protein
MGMSCIKVNKNFKLYSIDKSKYKTTRPHIFFKKNNKKLLFYFYTLYWKVSQKLSKQKTPSIHSGLFKIIVSGSFRSSLDLLI